MSSSSVMPSIPPPTQRKSFRTRRPTSDSSSSTGTKIMYKTDTRNDESETKTSTIEQSNKSRIPTKDIIYEKKRKTYQQTMDTLSKEIEELKQRSTELSEKLKLTLSGEEGRAERDSLLDSLQKLRRKRDEMTEEKTALVKQLDATIDVAKSRGMELEAAREKLPCKRIEDLNAKIVDLEKKIESGIPLTEEKRIVAEISKLHKSRRSFDSISSLIVAKEQVDSQLESTRTSIKKLDIELKSLRNLIKEQNDKYAELMSKKTNSTTFVQGIKKSLDEIRSQIDEKFKQRTLAYEEFSVAKEAHNQWAAERLAKYQAMQARREVEDEMRTLEKELRDLSVDSVPPEIDSLNALEAVITNCIPQKTLTNASTIAHSLTPRVVEAIDSTKYQVMEKIEVSYFEGYKKTSSVNTNTSANSKTNFKSNSTSMMMPLPPWAILDLEVYGIGSVRSVEDAENAIKRIALLKEKINQSTLTADQEKETKRVGLRSQIETTKAKLTSLENNNVQISN